MFRITVQVPREFLPDIIRQIMPVVGGGLAEPSGVNGLRATVADGIVELSRPELSAVIRIPASQRDWELAAKVAFDDFNPDVELAWVTHPDRWHPEELALMDAYPSHCAIGGEYYRNSSFASAVLRRLPGMCPNPETTEYHSLWINHWGPGDAYSIQLEWCDGPAHRAFLDRLLDPVAGLDAEITLFKGQTLADCYSDDPRQVCLASRDNTRNTLVLRRSVDKSPVDEPLDDQASEPSSSITSFRHQRRRSCEAKYSY